MQAVESSEVVAPEVALSRAVNRMRDLLARYNRALFYVNIDWWVRHAVLMHVEAGGEYVYVVADNGLCFTVDLRPLKKGKQPYYSIDHAGGDGCAED